MSAVLTSEYICMKEIEYQKSKGPIYCVKYKPLWNSHFGYKLFCCYIWRSNCLFYFLCFCSKFVLRRQAKCAPQEEAVFAAQPTAATALNGKHIFRSTALEWSLELSPIFCVGSQAAHFNAVTLLLSQDQRAVRGFAAIKIYLSHETF